MGLTLVTPYALPMLEQFGRATIKERNSDENSSAEIRGAV